MLGNIFGKLTVLSEIVPSSEFKTVEKLIQRKGSVNFDRKTNKFRVRVTTDSGRKCLGFFLTFEEANNVLSDYLINNKF